MDYFNIVILPFLLVELNTYHTLEKQSQTFTEKLYFSATHFPSIMLANSYPLSFPYNLLYQNSIDKILFKVPLHW